MARRLRIGAIGLALVLLGACAQAPKPIYYWESFPRQQYEVLQGSADVSAQIRDLEAHAEKSRGANLQLPPGFRAHLGMLYLSSGDAAGARSMWEAEKAAFPESTPYMDQLLKRLATPPAEAKSS